MLNRLPYRQRSVATIGMVVFAAGVILQAEDQPEPPKIALAAPFAIAPQATTKVVLRGWKLNRDIEAKTTVADVTLKVLKHDNASAPNGQDVKHIGDSLVELEVTVLPGFTGETVPIALKSGDLESNSYSLLVGGRHPIVAEAEPNDGFRQAQPLVVPGIVDGQIHADRNVDVYAIELAAQQRLRIDVVARRQGSGLDSLLTVYDAKGRKVASNDDAEGVDSKIDELFAPGKYYLVVQDAHDHGGPAHPYRLIVQP